MAGNEVKLVDLEIVDADASRTESSSYCIWQYFTVSNSSDPQKGAAKIAVCKFCDKTFSGCCTSRAAAHIFGHSVLGQAKAGIQACITINKKDDDRRFFLKNAQRALGEVMRGQEDANAGKKVDSTWKRQASGSARRAVPPASPPRRVGSALRLQYARGLPG